MKRFLLFFALASALVACEPESPVDPDDPTTTSEHLLLGNPSAATTSQTNLNNYLMVKKQYALSYNNSLGHANWVSWRLGPEWRGTAERQNDFRGDTTLPSTFYAVPASVYTGTGFDRGHFCPSEDRDNSVTDNSATFLTTNIFPQAPACNQVPWAQMEDYCRTLMDANNELYFVAGTYGVGGSGSNGGTTNTIGSGKVTVPKRVYKIAVIISRGSNDLTRITSSTRIIAVDMPNSQTADNALWGTYRVSVDDLEALTGYDFLNTLSLDIQESLESRVDNGPTQ